MPHHLDLGLVRLFCRARHLSLAVLTCIVVGLAAYVFAVIQVPTVSPGVISYQRVTVYTMAPPVASVAMVTILASGMSDWEAVASRPLWRYRASIVIAGLAISAVALLPAGSTHPVKEPYAVMTEGIAMSWAIGLLTAGVGSYLVQVYSIFGYAIVSVNFGSLLPANAKYVPLLGGTVSSTSLATASGCLVLALVIYCRRPSPPIGRLH